MITEPKTNDDNFRLKWRQLHFLIGVQRSRIKNGPLVLDAVTAEHICLVATHEAIEHASPFYGETQVEEFNKRYNEVLDYFAPADTTITRGGSPLHRK